MKKYSSVFSLFVRSSVYKIIPLFVLSGVIQIALFTYNLNSLTQWDGTALGIEPIIEKSRLDIVFIATMLVLAVILSIVGCEFGSKPGYSIRRLNISEKQMLICQAIFNSLVYILFIVFEFALSLIIFEIYFSQMENVNIAHPGFLSNQTMFLAFYRSEFLHSLLPLQDYFRAVRNIIYIFTLGFSLAAFPYFQRRKAICFEGIINTLFVALTFFADWTETGYEIFYIFATAFLASILLYRLNQKGAAYEK